MHFFYTITFFHTQYLHANTHTESSQSTNAHTLVNPCDRRQHQVRTNFHMPLRWPRSHEVTLSQLSYFSHGHTLNSSNAIRNHSHSHSAMDTLSTCTYPHSQPLILSFSHGHTFSHQKSSITTTYTLILLWTHFPIAQIHTRNHSYSFSHPSVLIHKIFFTLFTNQTFTLQTHTRSHSLSFTRSFKYFTVF